MNTMDRMLKNIEGDRDIASPLSADLELLVLAAKAAGIEIVRSRLHDPVTRDMLIKAPPGGPQALIGWNPRDDDGDSRRLEVALKMDLNIDEGHTNARVRNISAIVDNQSNTDPCAAARLAVLRCAAGVGRAMP